MQLGPYVVERELGRGGASVVFAGRAPDGRLVAVKLLNASRSGEGLARFERERRLLSGFTESEGFVALVDHGASAHGPYLVAPLVEGGTLRDRLARGPLAIPEIVALGRTLGAALGVAHARGVVHRDVKPENVLFTREGRPLLSDLGVAKHFRRDLPGAEESKSLSLTGALHGTIAYMAPEQVQGSKGAEVGPPADVFALGVVIYECLTGTTPFESGTVYETLVRIESGSFTPVRDLRHDVPRALERVIERALAREAAARFEDGLALARALGALDAPGRGRRSVAPLAVGALLLAGAGALLAVLASGARSPTRAPPGPGPKTTAPETTRALAVRPSRPPGERGPYVLEAERLLAADPIDVPALKGAVEAAGEREPGAAAWALRGWLRLLTRDSRAEAIADAERALALDPKCARAWLTRGSVRLLAEDPAAALTDLEEAVRLAPEDADALERRGDARLRTGDAAGALADAETILARHPRSARAFALRGHVKQNQRDWAGAEQDFTRAIEIAGDALGGVPWAERGQMRRWLGDMAGALADSDHAVLIDPENGAVWLDRGAVHYARNAFDDAERDFARGLELAPRSAAGWQKRALGKIFTGDDAGAVLCATTALDLDPKDILSLCVRAQARLHLGELDGASSDAAAVLAREPRWPSALTARADVARRQGRGDEAARDLEVAISRDRASPFAFTARGLLRAELGQVDDALADLDQACALPRAARLPWPFRARGLLRAREGRAGAREDLERALSLLPKSRDDAEIRAALAKLGASQGDGPSGR